MGWRRCPDAVSNDSIADTIADTVTNAGSPFTFAAESAFATAAWLSRRHLGSVHTLMPRKSSSSFQRLHQRLRASLRKRCHRMKLGVANNVQSFCHHVPLSWHIEKFNLAA